MPVEIPFGGAAAGHSAQASRMCAVSARNRCGMNASLLDRGDGAAVAAAARDDLSGIERQLKISVRTCLEPGHAPEVDQPCPVHAHDVESCQPHFLGGQ